MSFNDKAEKGEQPKVALLFLVSFFASFLVFLLMPFGTLVVSGADFPGFGREELLCYGAPLVLVVGALTFSALFFLSRMLPQIALWLVAALLGMSLAFYLQGNLIGADYGLLDGTPIQWESFRGLSATNSAVWCVCLLVPLGLVIWKGRSAVRPLTTAAFAFFCYSILVGSYFISATSSAPPCPVRFSLDRLLEFSSRRNVIVLVADSFDRGLFDRILQDDPDWTDRLRGFTYYPMTTGCFVGTNLALPELITGSTDYRGEGDAAAYVRRAYADSPTLTAARDLGYEVDLYADYSIGPTEDEARRLGVFGNVLKDDCSLLSSARRATFFKLMKLSLFRYLPHLVKASYWRFLFKEPRVPKPADAEDGISYAEVEAALAEALEKNAVTVVDRPKLKIYHVKGTHAPRFAPEWGEKTLALLLRLRECVESAGLADRTTVFCLADHGFINRQRPLFLRSGAGEFRRVEQPFSYRHLSSAFASALRGEISELPLPEIHERYLLSEPYKTRDGYFDGIGSDFSGDALGLIGVDESFLLAGAADAARLEWRGGMSTLSLPIEPDLRTGRLEIRFEFGSAAEAEACAESVRFKAFTRPVTPGRVQDSPCELAFSIDIPRQAVNRNYLRLELDSSASDLILKIRRIRVGE